MKRTLSQFILCLFLAGFVFGLAWIWGESRRRGDPTWSPGAASESPRAVLRRAWPEGCAAAAGWTTRVA